MGRTRLPSEDPPWLFAPAGLFGGQVRFAIVRGARLRAMVVRCSVSALDPHDGIVYRGGLSFLEDVELHQRSDTMP